METAFAIFLDGKVRPWTVRATARQCRENYARATRQPWNGLLAAGFRCRKVTLTAADEVPPDVARLVVAAREAAFGDHIGDRTVRKALDDASEAFADRVRWDDEPGRCSHAPVEIHKPGCRCALCRQANALRRADTKARK